MSNYHIKMEKIKSGEEKAFAWTVYNFDTLSEMREFQDRANEVHRLMMSEQNNGSMKTVSITGEVKA